MHRLRFRRGKGIHLSVIFTAVVVLSVTLTAALNTIVGFEAQKNSLSTNTLELNQITANELSVAVDTIFDSMTQSLNSASAHFANEANRGAQASAWLDLVRGSTSFFNSLALADENGKVTAVSPDNGDLVGQILKSSAAKQALTERKPLVSEPYVAVTNRLIVLVSQPIFNRDGTYRGFICGTIYLHEDNVLQKILGKHESNLNGSYYYVVDHRGNIIYHPDKSRIGDNVASNQAVAEIMAGKGGHMKIVNTKGVPMLAGYAIVPSTQWGIISQTPTATVTESVRGNVVRMALVSMPFILLLALLVIGVSHRLAFPLRRLAVYASLLNKGETERENVPVLRMRHHLIYEANELNRAVIDAFRVMGDRTEALSLEAHTDALTGLHNRRFFDSLLASWERQQMPYAVILMDLDRFKSVNDTIGHLKGDEVLRFLAARLNADRRDSDYACRYGGEEFVLLLPFGDKELAFQLAESVRIGLMEEESPIGRPVTLSLGIAVYPQDAASAAEVVHCADLALYRAKEEGRNRTVVYMGDYQED
ncbi:sensor domain-containing diguanylate cyclase [Cohnella sp. GbtcB17]|uniref:sensor domain-containing diguanylate cyclase n=1 Tax=Cohnella sp. GbtcB17 TaxID=2824762 RepID=UPI001C310756|nr:sensor domain-containing diguanylate cyclase [Cohnella sp. GbtcB17]